jgi:putative transposase
VANLCRRHGFSAARNYHWRNMFGGMRVSDAKSLSELENENYRFKRLMADALLENKVQKEALRKSDERTCAARAGAPHGQLRRE